MKFIEFIKTYCGFDWENGEIVVIDQRKGESYLCKCKNGEIIHAFHDMSYLVTKDVYRWVHSDKTMVITL